MWNHRLTGTYRLPNKTGEARSPALRARDGAALVSTQPNSASCQRRVAPVTLLTGNHPSPRLLWERYRDAVWERARWHGINCLRKRANSSPGWIFICQLSAWCHSSVWFTSGNAAGETYAKNIVYLMTATGLVTEMSDLFSMVKRNWINWTDLRFWIGKPKSVITCRQHCPYITDAYRQYAVVLVLLGTVQLLFPEWPPCPQKLTRHGVCLWKLWPQQQLRFGFLYFIY